MWKERLNIGYYPLSIQYTIWFKTLSDTEEFIVIMSPAPYCPCYWDNQRLFVKAPQLKWINGG